MAANQIKLVTDIYLLTHKKQHIKLKALICIWVFYRTQYFFEVVESGVGLE